MADVKETLLTAEGLKKLEEELAYYKSVRRIEVSERIKTAIEYGDISENSEYDDAKNEQAFIEGHIVELENKINTAKIIDESVKGDVVSVGSKVTVLDTMYNDELEYVIVGSSEADPFNNRISNESPVGKAILGKRKGDEVEVSTPDGPVTFKSVSNPIIYNYRQRGDNMSEEIKNIQEELNEQMQIRRDKLAEYEADGIYPFGQRFVVKDYAKDIKEDFFLKYDGQPVVIAGRLMTIRSHGKTAFANIRDKSGDIQVYFRKDVLGEDAYKYVKMLDIGDIIGIEGHVFKTHTGEVTIKVNKLTLLSKSLRPLPEKWHGLKDTELRYRQRYVDLIVILKCVIHL